MKTARQKKSTRGRRPGHLGKAHNLVHDEVMAEWQERPEAERQSLIAEGITPEKIKGWRHNSLANRGNYPQEVSESVFILGRLAAEYEQVLKRDRSYLEMNRQEVKIPLPHLPRGEHFDESDLLHFLQTGQDAIWAVSFLGYHEAFLLLGFMIRAVVEKDANFFEEMARRINSSFTMDVPLTSGAAPAYRALATLKDEYETKFAYSLASVGKLPLLEPVFKKRPGKRPPLTLAQIHEFVLAFGHVDWSDRALSRAAKLFGIPVARRGRRKNGT